MVYRKILYFHWMPSWVHQAMHMAVAIDIYHLIKCSGIGFLSYYRFDHISMVVTLIHSLIFETVKLTIR